MNRCDLLKTPPTSPGRIIKAQEITVRRWAAIGDCVSASVVADKLFEQGYIVNWVCHPSIHCVLRRQPHIARILDAGDADVNLDGAYERDPQRRRRHFSTMFVARANEWLRRLGVNLGAPLNCRPRIYVTPAERRAAAVRFQDYPKPWVFICPRSDSYACRQVPDGIWLEAARRINGTKFWVGRHPAPEGIVDLKCQNLDTVIQWLSVADLLVSVDTGPMHIAAALGVPVLALGQSSSPELHLSDQADFSTLEPAGLTCLNCQQNLCPVNRDLPPCQRFEPDRLAATVNAKAGQSDSGTISAVVAVWKPDPSVLNRCLTSILDQVNEIVVTAEAKSVVPDSAIKHPKIRYVRSPKSDIGYSGNANFGARHTVGQYLLMLNDDCFLDAGAVGGMKREMKPGVGVVSNLLRFADGRIYYAGKTRSPGQRGWSHLDYLKTTPTLRTVTEQENICGCCLLMRRSAFYEAGAFDEEIPLYAQDDAFALAIRQQGWRLIFTPFSTGIHLGSQSTPKIAPIPDLIRAAGAQFEARWGWYLTQNSNRIPGVFA